MFIIFWLSVYFFCHFLSACKWVGVVDINISYIIAEVTGWITYWTCICCATLFFGGNMQTRHISLPIFQFLSFSSFFSVCRIYKMFKELETLFLSICSETGELSASVVYTYALTPALHFLQHFTNFLQHFTPSL